MKVIRIEQDDQGVITVAVDDGDPMPVENTEGACEIVEGVLGGGEKEEEDQGAAAFAGGFNDVRQGGLNSGM